MSVLATEQEKKSLTITTIIFVLLFLLFFYLKFSNQVELSQLEGGGGGGEIAVNFGNSEFGSGDNYQSKEVVTVAPKQSVRAPSDEKEIIVSENDDAPVIAEVKKPAVKPVKTEVVKPAVKPTPKPSKSTSDALSNLLNGSSKEGDGNDKVGGNKGKANGDPNATGYNGGGGSGTGSGGGNGSGQGLGTGSGYGNGSGSGTGNGNGNYQLGNRKALNKPNPNYLCNEEGVVVVQISVDKSGRVINANPGVRGTTNAAKCLLDQAKIAAMSTRWQADDNAPEKQVGKIIYNFKLTQ
ncbi:energy transducer TonB [Flavobacterium sp. GT3R68]|uniref:energy transducer TonB n=1 Tax=Flavobacterium sp. GT3R68 TaxID=2594437 RepID=UPI000F876B6B|nr:energy transducer TonB [Flavobacterium sp. GT3R68]RTY88529.1 energy transducer TonB [Flavobacterium sp. GSN2]TRW92629.1 energy transducer TonB [Flavobacterium sp. GT3R68]